MSVENPANVTCPRAGCHGVFCPTDTPDVYECRECGRRLREVVVERLDAFKREAERDTPTAKVARAALEGVAKDGR